MLNIEAALYNNLCLQSRVPKASISQSSDFLCRSDLGANRNESRGLGSTLLQHHPSPLPSITYDFFSHDYSQSPWASYYGRAFVSLSIKSAITFGAYYLPAWYFPPVLAYGETMAYIVEKTIGERSPVSARFQNTGLTPCMNFILKDCIYANANTDTEQ